MKGGYVTGHIGYRTTTWARVVCGIQKYVAPSTFTSNLKNLYLERYTILHSDNLFLTYYQDSSRDRVLEPAFLEHYMGNILRGDVSHVPHA